MDCLRQRIEELKLKRNAVILAHNYQIDEVQEIADYVGDSLDLSRKAAQSEADVVVLAGVRFMAESASILAPEKTVLIPDPLAGCPLADSIDAQELRKKKKEYPDAVVVCYVNTSAEVKAESDICCTSTNAVAVVNSVPQERVLFVPDGNLADFVARSCQKTIIPWEGHCLTHNHLTVEDLRKARAAHPGAPAAVHPECSPDVACQADYVGSTGAILRYVHDNPAQEFLIGTEMGIIYRMRRENPGKHFYLISPGLVCPNMKLGNLEKIAACLENLEPVVKVPPDVADKARRSLTRMLEIA